jgi:para-nitrobenzyl esterase
MPKWPTYNLQTRSTMMLDAECQIENDPRGETRRLWQEITAR